MRSKGATRIASSDGYGTRKIRSQAKVSVAAISETTTLPNA
jgi:hypothetical protein